LAWRVRQAAALRHETTPVPLIELNIRRSSLR
jgi:hypothetical protein